MAIRRFLYKFNHFTEAVITQGLLLLIKIYRGFISPFLPARCRFYPTCSSYAIEAIKLHGGYRGGWLTLKRVCRCHPWGGSGIDFVPLPLNRWDYHYISRTPSGFNVRYWRLR